MFSKPDEDAKVNNPKEFFQTSPNENTVKGIQFTTQDVKEAI